MLYYVYYESLGVPTAGLTLAWEHLRTAVGKVDKSGTAIVAVDIGGGWYSVAVTYGTAPWDVTTEDLLGVIDGGAALANADRYEPIKFTVEGFAHQKIMHKGVQTKATGDIEYSDTDGSTAIFAIDMTDAASTLTRAPAAPA